MGNSQAFVAIPPIVSTDTTGEDVRLRLEVLRRANAAVDLESRTRAMCRLIEIASASGASRGLAARAALTCVAAMLSAVVAQANVPWHADVAQAKAASVISHRPVLLVFTAKWSDASLALEQTTLANSEAMALVTACFEPVKIDVDTDPETTRRMGVSYLPTACVIDLDERVLASFDCPDNPASFIAAAGRAAQDAAAAKAASQSGSHAESSTATVASAPPTTPRTSSDFSAAAHRPEATPPSLATEPKLPVSPPSEWPAEKAASPTAMPVAATTPMPTTPMAAARPSIEPAATPTPQQPSGVASWLGQQPPATPATAATPSAATAATATAIAPSTTASVPPAAPTAPAPSAPPTKPAEEEKPKQSNAFVAALQKPFAFLPKWPGTGGSKPATQPSTEPVSAAAATASDAHGSMPLGLEGYCPVTLIERGTWVEGRAQFGARHRGRTYLFAGAEQQQAFLADPDRYAPALSGDDPVLAFDSGKTVPGQRRYGVTYQTRIYLFSSTETRTAFTADPQKYTARVALAEGRGPAAGTIQR